MNQKPCTLGSWAHGCARSVPRLIVVMVPAVFTSGALAQTQNTTTNYAYDAQGNLTTITNPNGQVTTQTFDALNRRIQIKQPPPTTGAANPVIKTAYDGQDQVISVTDPRSLSTTYQIDGLGNLTQQKSPDTGTTTTTVDVAGNVLTSTDARNKTTTFKYDALNRVLSITYPTGTATGFTYDGGSSPLAFDIGHLTQITDESGSTRLQYDAYGHVIKKTQVSGSGSSALTQVVQYVYGTSGNVNGKLTSIVYPTGLSIGYTYDAAGRVLGLTLTPVAGTATPVVSGITYAPFGGVTGWTWGNGTAYSRTFDLDGRLSSYPLGALSGSSPTPNALLRTVDYDPASRITAFIHADATGSQTNPVAVAANQSFGYDNLDRLTGYSPSGTDQGYTYDASGNRISLTIGTTTYTDAIDPASNKLSSTTGPTPAKSNLYDAAGNLTSDGTVSYGYSDRGRQSSSTTASGGFTYLYNALGQRVVKNGPTTALPTGTVRFVYDEAGHLLGEYTGAGAPVQETVYLGDTPIAVLMAQ
jgi:YD repeat-containing protein